MAQEILEFGAELLKTRDLDPVYVVLYESKDDMGDNFFPWLVAYWCFYHMGTASWIVDQSDYWKAMETAAGSKLYSRGTERRHFRGENAAKSVGWLREYGLETIQDELGRLSYECGHAGGLPLREVMDFVEEWVGFGPWIAFKVADMLDRLQLVKIRFRPEDVFSMFDAPREGAMKVVERYCNCQPEAPEMWAYDYLIDGLGHYKAPPLYDRQINIQEVETILCKWKSHLNGHYEPGKDVEEVHKALLQCSKNKTAKLLLAAGSATSLWR